MVFARTDKMLKVEVKLDVLLSQSFQQFYFIRFSTVNSVTKCVSLKHALNLFQFLYVNQQLILYNVFNIHVHYLYVVKGWILQSSRINIVWLKSVFLVFVIPRWYFIKLVDVFQIPDVMVALIVLYILKLN